MEGRYWRHERSCRRIGREGRVRIVRGEQEITVCVYVYIYRRRVEAASMEGRYWRHERSCRRPSKGKSRNR